MNDVKCIVESQLNDSQKRCLDELMSIISGGENNATVLATPGWGLNTISYILAEKLKSRKIIFLSRGHEAVMITKHLSARGLDIECISLAQLEHNVEKVRNAELLFLHNMKYVDRRRISAYVNNQVVLSFATSGQSLTTDLNVENEECFALSGVQCLLYKTKELIDVRDVFFASFEEKQFLDNQFLKYKLAATELLVKKLNERNHQSEQEIINLKSKVDFQNRMLRCVGMQASEIDSYLQEMMKHKTRISELSCDDEAKERFISDSQDAITRILCEIKDKYANQLAVTSCENDIRSNINDSIWHRLDNKTKSYLVTAKYTFESILKEDKDFSMDYSGVCLLITKSVELESSKRFFAGYSQYLYEKYQSRYDLWPKSMVFYDKNTGELKPSTFYTLGTFVSIVKINGGKFSPDFLNYAQRELYSKMTPDEIKTELSRDCKFIEWVRCKYRNPAAHTGALKQIGAKECFEYVIEVHKMLQKMISSMDY